MPVITVASPKGRAGKSTCAVIRATELARVGRPDLMERAAFLAFFKFGGNLRTMPPQGNMAQAAENAAKFAQALYQRLAGTNQ